MSHPDVEVITNDVMYDNFVSISKISLRFKLFSGDWSPVLERHCFDSGESSFLVLYDVKRDCVVLIEQFRIGAMAHDNPWMLEVVAGVIVPGESPEEVALRECQEETGTPVQEAFFIQQCMPSAGISTHQNYLFYSLIDSELFSGVHGLAEEGENIKVHVVSREQAYAWVCSGKITSVMTVIGLQWLQLNYASLQAQN